MNLVLFHLSFLFASYAPSMPTTNDGNDGNDGTTVTDPGTGKDKGGKFGDGDYVIWSDVHP